MVQLKVNNASKSITVPNDGVPANEKNREEWCWNLLRNTKIKPVVVMLYQTLHFGFAVWLFSYFICVVTENPGPDFVIVSTHFNYSFAGLNLEPGINYLLWISVLAVAFNCSAHFGICVGILYGDNLVELFAELFPPNFLSKWLTSHPLHIFLNGFVLAFLRLNELPTSPLVIYLLIVHTCSGIVVLSYYMQMLSLRKQSPATPDVSVKGDNLDKKSLKCSSAYKIIHLIFTIWLNLCVILFIMKTNAGPAFVEVGKHFGVFWEPYVNLMLWWFVWSLHLSALYHANIGFKLFAGTNNQLIVFGRPVETDYMLIRLYACFAQVFGCGVLLLQLYEVPISPHILYLLILHTISGVVYLSYMGMLQTAKQIPTPTVDPVYKHDDDGSDSDVTDIDDSDSYHDNGDQPTVVVTTK